MKRIVLTATGVVLAMGIFALPALAHGGQFRGPGDGVPPGLREPSDPTPPPPPPPSGPPTTPTPTTPSSTPTPATPTTPTTAPPPTTTPTSPTHQPRTSQPSFEDWTFWYHNNKADIEELKSRLYKVRGSDNPLFHTGDETDSGRTAATRMTQKKVQDAIIPALLWAMDPKNSGYQDTESAAYIALAKVATDLEQIKLIEDGLDKDKKHDVIVQESAALALGLLRRADPAKQFTARDLDNVRTFLFKVFEDKDYKTRTRGFAVVAIGLLGDQPTGSGDYANDVDAAARATTKHLFDLLQEKYADENLAVGLLMAIGLQPHTSVDKDQRDALAEAAVKGRLYKDNVSELTRAYAAHTLGQIGTITDIKVLETVLTTRRGMGKNIQRSAAIGLGLLGRLVSGSDRVDTAKILLDTVKKSKDPSTTNFGIISLAYLIIDDIQTQTTDVVGNTTADEKLLELAEKGNYMERPFGALALALILRAMPDDLEIDRYQQFKEEALKVLRAGVAEGKGDKKTQAAFCTAVGIAHDDRSREALRQIVDDKKEDKMLRGYACLGLGLIGLPTKEITQSIADAMRERSSEDLRRQSAVALGLLGPTTVGGTGKTAIELLLEELKEAKSQAHKGQVVLALASIGNEKAVDPLVEILKSKSEQDLTRALACAGLGLIGDLEWIPSLARASTNVNYRASTDLVNELLSIL